MTDKEFEDVLELVLSALGEAEDGYAIKDDEVIRVLATLTAKAMRMGWVDALTTSDGVITLTGKKQ